MIRTQIQLTEDQSEALKQIATHTGKSIAELVRLGVDQVIRSHGVVGPAELRQRALGVVGRFHLEDENLASEHDRYAAQAYES